MKASPKTRQDAYERDLHRCIRCGAMDPLSVQHRKAGGSPYRPTITEIVTACILCNQAFEHAGQSEALKYGWKIRTRDFAAKIPVYYAWRGTWAVLGKDSGLTIISQAEARQMMDDAYGKIGYLEILDRATRDSR